MTENKIINKTDCLNSVNDNLNNIEISYIHPLFSYHNKHTFTKEEHYILPQLIDNNLKIINQCDQQTDNIKINSDSETSQEIIQSTNIDPLLYFTSPINSNNFLEIVFNISNISQLNQWINLIDNTEIELLSFILDLYWKNYYNKIDEDIDNFIIVNKKIFKKFFYKDISNEILLKIINRLLKNNFGKKIKYITKIKKYLTKYI